MKRDESDVDAILNRAGAVSLTTLDIDLLREMLEGLEKDRAELREKARAIEVELEKDLHERGYKALTERRAEIRGLQEENEELEESHNRIFDAYQHKIVDRKMAERFGGLRRWRIFEGFIMVLILGVLGMLYYEFVTPDLSLDTRRVLTIIDFSACMIFLFEFFIKLSAADSKRWFWKTHWVDFVTSIPIPDLEALRFGRAARLVRVVRVLRLLRVVRLVFFFWRGMDQLNEIFNVKLMKKSLVFGIVLLLLGAFTIFWIEGGSGDGVADIPQSIWWSFTTVVTGGYGDIHNPTSVSGRFLTVVLVIMGMTLVGIFTATLTSILVPDSSDEVNALKKEMEERFNRLEARLDQK